MFTVYTYVLYFFEFYKYIKKGFILNIQIIEIFKAIKYSTI